MSHEFPRLVYRKKSGKDFDHQLVDTQDAYDEQIAAGWYHSVPDAMSAIPASAKPVEQADDEKLPTRAELEEQADKLGMKYDRRIGDKKLSALIDEALAK